MADHWYKGDEKNPAGATRWCASKATPSPGLQSIFAENWLESSGEILTGYDYFPFTKAAIKTTAMVVGSAPTTGQVDHRARAVPDAARVRKQEHLHHDAVLPARQQRPAELMRAVQRTKLDVKIVVPGHHNDHLMTRRSSRRLYGDVLEAGAKIYEYQPSMIHTKSLIVDGMWGVVGSTNFDSRSFGINDEVNLAVLDPAFAKRLEQDFQNDVSQSREITFEQWKNRPHSERAHEWVGSLLERQQ